MVIDTDKTANKTPDQKTNQSLFDFAKWDIKTIDLLSKMLVDYESAPLSKSLIQNMIRFEDMYQDISPGPFHVSSFEDLEGKNDERRGRRARLYLAKKDLVKSVGDGNGKRLILTTRAHKVFYEEYPLAQLRKNKWNGEWVIVVYDFPEEMRVARNFIRNKLIDLGFGIPQESILISPLPLSEPVKKLVDGEGMEKYVWVLTAQRVLGLPNEAVATQAWSLDRLDDLYSKLLQILPSIKKTKKKNLFSEWKKYFLAVDAADPYLPIELLPEDWRGEICKKEFARLGFSGLLKSIFSSL